MPLFQLIVLAVVQGVTEFLPISSSAHLILVPHLTGWADQGRMMDVAVHVGTLGAVVLYAWREVGRMAGGLIELARGRPRGNAHLLLQVSVASMPVFVAGYLVAQYLGEALRTVEVIAWATIVFGLLLWLADRVSMTVLRLEHLNYRRALIVGLAQALALVPGTSRAGITMTAARFLGFERSEAARLSLILGIPAILGAGAYEGLRLFQSGNSAVTMDAVIAAFLALGFALIGIAVMMAWLRRGGFAPFVAYRLALGAGLLGWLYLG